MIDHLINQLIVSVYVIVINLNISLFVHDWCVSVCLCVCVCVYLFVQPADWPGKGSQAQTAQPLHGHSRDHRVALGHAGSCSALERTGNCSCSADWTSAA